MVEDKLWTILESFRYMQHADKDGEAIAKKQ